MLCDNCKQRQANVHITKIVNNEKMHLNLCEDCAREYQQEWGFSFQSSFSLHKFLAGLLDEGALAGETAFPEVQKCLQCGLTRQAFSQYGKLGCDRCYETFGSSLGPLLRKVHGREKHTGKVPQRTGGRIRLRKQLDSLRQQLQALVAREEFEEAARVRDRIREMENKLEEQRGE